MPHSPPRISYLIGRLDRSLAATIGARIAEYGLTVNEYTALSILKASPGLSNAQMARRTLVRPQSMIQVTSSLERTGLITRERSAHHAKVLRAALTPAGRRVLAQCERAVSGLEESFLAELSVHERDVLRQQLVALSTVLEREGKAVSKSR